MNPTSTPKGCNVYRKSILAASSHLLQGFSKAYKHLPEFKTRSKKLEELNNLL
jgi:hypothetical protein